jgi:hypothetical protein
MASRRVAGFAAIIAACASLPAAAWADSGADVTGTVTTTAPSTPCVIIDNSSVDFGTLDFSRSGLPLFGDGAPDTTLTNCSASNSVQYVFAHGSDAVGPDGRWRLTTSTDTCTAGPDVYAYRLSTPPSGVNAVFLTGVDAQLPGTLTGVPQVWRHRLYMPCVGSTGGQMTMHAIFTVTF